MTLANLRSDPEVTEELPEIVAWNATEKDSEEVKQPFLGTQITS